MKEELFLPKNYIFNKPASNEVTANDFWDEKKDNNRTFLWQAPVYNLANTYIQQNNSKTICDIGCGTGFKTTKYLCYSDRKVYGIDQKSGISVAKACNENMTFVEFNIEEDTFFEWLKKIKPDFVILSDVIEHLEFPRKALINLFNSLEKNTLILISTPDRSKLDILNNNGAPLNKRHVQEWTDKEFNLLVEDIGFSVVKRQHLFPRKYGINFYELSRCIYRLFKFRQIPDKKSCMTFLLRKN